MSARWQAELFLDLQLEVGEGPVWDHRTDRLHFLDVHAGELYSAGLDGATVVRGLGQGIGSIGLAGQHGFVVGTSEGFALLEPGGYLEPIPGFRLAEGLRMNDCQVGPDRGFWGGSMKWYAEPGTGTGYRLAPEGTVTTFAENVTISNGIGWAPDDRTMYYTDSHTHTIDAFDFDAETGSATGRRPVAAVPDGLPDGLCVDQEGSIWVAVFGQGAVYRYAPDGRLTGRIAIPTGMATSCCFGGPDLDLLFITSASAGIDPWERHRTHAGAVFVARPGVPGRQAFVFDRS